MTTLFDDIRKMVEEYRPPVDSFNGATRLVMSPDVFRELAPHIEDYAKTPLIRPRIEIDILPTMLPSYAMGFRPWRDGDDPEIKMIGEVLVWFCGPEADKT
jgi:hypothetical protein